VLQKGALPDAAEHRFLCSIGGHNDGATGHMRGTLVVR